MEFLARVRVTRLHVGVGLAAAAATSLAVYLVNRLVVARAEEKAKRGPPVPADKLIAFFTDEHRAVADIAKIDSRAAFALPTRADREAASEVMSSVMRKDFDKAEEELLAKHGLSEEEATDAWRVFLTRFEANKHDEEAKRVVEAGWLVKSSCARYMFDKATVLQAVHAMMDEARREIPAAMARVQDRMDKEGASEMPPKRLVQLAQVHLQRAGEEILGAAESRRLKKEWGVPFATLQSTAQELGKKDRAFLQVFNKAVKRFEDEFEGEQEALFKSYGLA